MPEWLALVFEIIKISVPALIVYFTAKHLLARHLMNSERLMAARNHAAKVEETLPLRLQAYERLSLFCERIAIPNLLLRLQDSEQNASQLKLSLFLAIQQEYEHNISQQVYMSENLWGIIKQARDNTLQAIDSVSDIIEPDMPARTLSRALVDQAAPSSNASLALALKAIKREASTLFD